MNRIQTIASAKKQDEQAIDHLMHLVAKKGKYIALSYTCNDEIKADTILKNAYIKAFRSLDNLQAPHRFESWFYTILNREGIRATQMKIIEKNLYMFGDGSNEDTDIVELFTADEGGFEPRSQWDYQIFKQAIHGVMDELPGGQKEAVLMYYFEGLKISDIAMIFDVSSETVKSWIRYANKKMKDAIVSFNTQEKDFLNISSIPFLIWMLEQETQNVSVQIQADVIIQALKEPGNRPTQIQKRVPPKPIKRIPSKMVDQTMHTTAYHSTDTVRKQSNTDSKTGIQIAGKTITTKMVGAILTSIVCLGGVGIGTCQRLPFQSAKTDERKAANRNESKVAQKESESKIKEKNGAEELPIFDQAIFSHGYTSRCKQSIVLYSDHSFTGEYSNVYSGVVEVSHFRGKITNVKKVSEKQYTFILADVSYSTTKGDSWDENERHYEGVAPAIKIEGKYEYYSSGTNEEELSSAFQEWMDQYEVDGNPQKQFDIYRGKLVRAALFNTNSENGGYTLMEH